MDDADLFSGVAGKVVRATESSPAGTSDAPAPPSGTPEELRYKGPDGKAWRVERFVDLATEFELTAGDAGGSWPETMERFHLAVSTAYPRGWQLTRLRFGAMPMVTPLDADPDEHRVWRPMELMARHNLTRAQLGQEFDECRRVWQVALGKIAAAVEEDPGLEPAPADAADGDDDETPEQTLAAYHFSEGLFSGSVDGPSERLRFVERVREVRDFLGNRMTSQLARRMLMNELQSWRLETEVCKARAGSKQWNELTEARSEMDKEYRAILDDLDAIFPWKKNVGGTHGFKAVLSDVVRALQQFRQDGSRVLVDRVQTAAEIQVLFRQSVHRPMPQYRMGQLLHIRSAIEGIWDPNWKPPYSNATLAKWDKLGQMAIEEARKGLGEELVDLLKPGEAGEYPDNRQGTAAREEG